MFISGALLLKIELKKELVSAMSSLQFWWREDFFLDMAEKIQTWELTNTVLLTFFFN